MFILLVHKKNLPLIINDKKALLIIITEVSLAKNKHLRIKRKLVCQLNRGKVFQVLMSTVFDNVPKITKHEHSGSSTVS